jgi:exodeoxyribonuclease VII small subunit
VNDPLDTSARARPTADAVPASRPRGAADKAPAAEPSSFEDATRRLGDIVTQLEGGDLPLERSLELFEEGVRLARAAQDRLDKAERRVEELLGVDGRGAPITRDFEG